MKYEIVSASSTYQLASLVQEKLNQGWMPHGSPFHVMTQYSGSYLQAIIKNDGKSSLRLMADESGDDGMIDSRSFKETDNGGT